jgi:predicted ATPase
MELNSITLKNFKSHEDNEFELGKITLFIGHNNAGKSSVLQALIMLSQSAKQMNTMGLAPKNGVIDLGEYRDIVRLNDEEIPLSVSIEGSELIDLGGEYDKIITPESAKFYFTVIEQKRNLTEINFNVESKHTKIDYNWKRNGTSATLTRPFENQSFTLRQMSLNGFMPAFQLTEGPEEIRDPFNRQFANGDFLKNIFHSFYYIPFQRTIGKYAVSLTMKRSIDDIVTADPEQTSSVLLSTLSKDAILRQKVSTLYASIFEEEMSSHNVDPAFQQGGQNTERISLLFSKGKFASSIANEGGGINQLVLLFAILAGSPKKSVICLEEPEIHLHPAKQSQLMKTIMRIAKDEEKQIILTTHSEYILYPLLAAVSSGSLKPKDLSIYYFQYDNKNHKTSAEKLIVNDKGQLKGGLKGFWEATVSAMSEFIDEEK